MGSDLVAPVGWGLPCNAAGEQRFRVFWHLIIHLVLHRIVTGDLEELHLSEGLAIAIRALADRQVRRQNELVVNLESLHPPLIEGPQARITGYRLADRYPVALRRSLCHALGTPQV